MLRTKWKWFLLAAPAFALAGASLFTQGEGRAAPGDDEAAQRKTRCATRLAVALTGKTASAELLAAADPQAQVPALLASPELAERFARFVNAKLNEEPGMAPVEDASYWLSKKIVSEKLPWSDLFVGKYRVAVATDAAGKATAEVVADPDGLGYFRSPAWMRRYAGNEEDGYRLVSAYRIMQNVVGLDLKGVDNAPGADVSATGREAPACRGCHYEGPFPLDKVAKILSRRNGTGANISFTPPDEGPQEILDGQMVANDAELVGGLVDSDNYKFRACRLVFQFLYGRDENTCEAPVFDRCMQAMAMTDVITDGLAAVAQDPSYCD